MHFSQIESEQFKVGVEKKLENILTQAILVSVESEFDESKKPDWYDEDKFKKSIQLAKKYFVSLYTSHFIGLLLVIQFPCGLAPLLATGNSSTVPKLFRRYLSTLVHTRNFYESDPFIRGSTSWKTVQQVRRMHKNVGHLMNTKYSDKLGNKKGIWMNQHDFVMTQWSFISQIFMNPQHCGIHSDDLEEFDQLNYLWRVIGYCMGIDDQYNLCCENPIETKLLCQMIFDRCYKPNLELVPHPTPLGWEMGKGIALAMRMISPSVSWEAIINYWYPKLGLNYDHVTLNSWFSKFAYCYLNFHYHGMMRLSWFHWVYSWGYKKMIDLAIKRKQIREQILGKKYPDLKYEEQSECPYQIDLDYVDAFNDKTPNATGHCPVIHIN